MSNRFWRGMTKKVVPSLTDKILVGDVATDDPQYMERSDFLKGLVTKVLSEDETIDATGHKLSIKCADDATGIGAPTSQLQVGTLEEHVAPYLQESAVVSATQKFSSNGENPAIFAGSIPEALTPNGFLFYFYGNAGKVRPEIRYQSNYAQTNPNDFDAGCATMAVIEETSTDNNGFVFAVMKTSTDKRFGVGLPLENPDTKVFRIRNGRAHIGTDLWYVRTNGDMHVKGTLFLKLSEIAVNTAVALNSYKYISKATESIEITLPDPTTCNEREHLILNHGSANVTFNYPIWLDKVTNISSLDYSFPNNQLHVFSDGAKWIGYR